MEIVVYRKSVGRFPHDETVKGRTNVTLLSGDRHRACDSHGGIVTCYRSEEISMALYRFSNPSTKD